MPRIVTWGGAFLLGCLLTVSHPALAGGVVDTILNVVNRIETRVNQIRSTVNSTSSRIVNLPETVQNRLGIGLDGDVRDRLMGAFTDIRTTIDRENTLLEAFGDGSPGTGCFIFRQDLIALVQGGGNLADAILTIGTISDVRMSDMRTGTRDLATVIESLPCAILLPVSVAVAEGTPLGIVADGFIQAFSAIETIAPLYETTAGRAPLLECPFIVDNADDYKNAGIALGSLALLFKAIGAIVDSDDMIGPPDGIPIEIREPKVGIHGYVNVTLKPPEWRKRLSRMFDSLFELTLAASEFTFTRVRHCEVVTNQEALLAGQQELMMEVCTITRFRSDPCRALLSSRR